MSRRSTIVAAVALVFLLAAASDMARAIGPDAAAAARIDSVRPHEGDEMEGVGAAGMEIIGWRRMLVPHPEKPCCSFTCCSPPCCPN